MHHRHRQTASTTASRPSAVGTRAIKVEPLTCRHRRRAVPTSTWATASRDAGLVAEIRALLLKSQVLFFRDQDITRAEHVAFARHFGELEDHPVAGSDPDHPGLVRIYKSPDSPTTATRTRGTPTPPGARSRRSAACCAASSARPSAATRCGSTWRWPTSACPSTSRTQIAGLRARHSIEASFGAAMPIEKRLALKAQFPDAEHPVVRTHPETGEKVAVRQRVHDAFHELPHAGQRALRPGLQPGRQRSCCSYLISQAYIPEYQVRFRWKNEQHGVLGQPQHAALRGDGLPAVPSARWSAPASSATLAVLNAPRIKEPRETSPCTSSTTPCSPRTGEAHHAWSAGLIRQLERAA